MKTNKVPTLEKQLRSLVRERQRIWTMYFHAAGNVRITLSSDSTITVFRESVSFNHVIIDQYLTALDARIKALSGALRSRDKHKTNG